MYDPARHQSDQQVIDRGTGRVFDRYDQICLYERETDLYYERDDYEPDDEASDDDVVEIDGTITANGVRFCPFRRCRTGAGLREEVAGFGFEVVYQSGELGENLVAVHRGAGAGLCEPRSHRYTAAAAVAEAAACSRLLPHRASVIASTNSGTSSGMRPVTMLPSIIAGQAKS